MKPHYETDDTTFSADGYTVKGSRGVAWNVYGWHVEADADTEWSGIEERTGSVVVCMKGDDRLEVVDLSDIAPLAREAYCGSCGQIGCTHDGMDRSGVQS